MKFLVPDFISTGWALQRGLLILRLDLIRLFFAGNTMGPSVYSQCKGVQGDQYLDAVDAFATDRLPRVVGVHEVSILDLVFDGHVLVEGELAGKRYVDDHTHGPHVQGSVESLLA